MMAFKKVITEDQTLQLIQDNIAEAFRPIQSSPLVSLNVVSGVSLTTGQDNLIAHGLGRTPQVWILAGTDVGTRLWSQSSTELGDRSANSKLINIQCLANCTVNLIFA